MAIRHVSDLDPTKDATHKLVFGYMVVPLGAPVAVLQTVTLELTEAEAEAMQGDLERMGAHASPETQGPALRPVAVPSPSGGRRAPGRTTPKPAGGPASGRPAGQPASGRTTVDRDQAAAIRRWAKQQGIELNDRGRIPADVLERYNAEAGQPALPQPQFSAASS